MRFTPRKSASATRQAQRLPEAGQLSFAFRSPAQIEPLARFVRRSTRSHWRFSLATRYADRIETSVNGTLSFPSLPPDLRDRPTLVTDLDNGSEGAQDVELTYLTGGLSWKADYTALLSAADDRVDLRGMITLENASGTAYRNASVQLVAGDVNVVQPQLKTRVRARTPFHHAPE